MNPSTTGQIPNDGGDGTKARSPPDRSMGFSMVSLSWLAAGAGVMALGLHALQKALQLPSGYGIEDLLGWSNPQIIWAAITNWCSPQSGRWPAAAVYVLADTALFMPLYGALILEAARSLGKALKSEPAPLARLLNAGLQPATWLFVVALWFVDGAENLGGAQRIGMADDWFFASAAVGVALFVVLWHTVRRSPEDQKHHTCRNVAAILVAMLLLVVIVLVQRPFPTCQQLLGPIVAHGDFDLGWAHRFKPWMLAAALAPVTFAAVVWWFGMDLDLSVITQCKESHRRAAWRSGVTGVIGRTRYVIALLCLFGVFTLVLDQCRDVLLALAAPRDRETDPSVRAAVWSGFVLVLGAMSVGMLAYSCWMWTRLAAMIERPGLALPGGRRVYEQVGEFSRGWARAMSLAPLAMFCVLIAQTVGDAVAASRAVSDSDADTLRATLIWLSAFATLAIVSGYAFLELRRRFSLSEPQHYYNSEPDAYMLLRTGTTMARAREANGAPEATGCIHHMWWKLWSFVPSRISRSLSRLSGPLKPLLLFAKPIAVPLVALGLMVIVRTCMALWPDTTSQAPATFMLLCLCLVWWMGVAGAISLAEQRQTIPWMLVIVGVVGLLGWAGVTNNHVMPLSTLSGTGDSALEDLRSMRHMSLAVTLLLAVPSAVLWSAATYRSDSPQPIRMLLRYWRWALVGLAVAGVYIGLHVVDRQTRALLRPTEPVDAKRSMDEVMRQWVRGLPHPTSNDKHLYLVASEGGGIRSAYWTAQVLALLHDRQGTPSFGSRTAVLSGVSGGAVGEAVYIACLRLTPQGGLVSDCVRTRFARMDALSPLIGALMFEDVFARVLPVHTTGSDLFPCDQPGCGYLSRALGFEREWMRNFPALADALGNPRQGEPELMLNSTLVESGNRATLSTMRLMPQETPGSEDVRQRLGASPSLITAAHAAARFPFINPLGALQPAKSSHVIGHLADGGYHDNSGAESLSDVLRSMRTGAIASSGWVPQLVLIRNGQLKPGCEKKDHVEPVYACIADGGQYGKPDLFKPLDKPQWDLYVDFLGPPVTVVNVSGIGARARQATGALGADLSTLEKESDGQPLNEPRFLDQTTDATLVPLGWYLSPAARKALDRLAACKVGGQSCAVAANGLP